MPPKFPPPPPPPPEPTWISYQPRTRGGKVRVVVPEQRQVRAAVAKRQHAARRAADARKRDSSFAWVGPDFTIDEPHTQQLIRNTTLSGEASRSLLWTRIILHTDLHAMALFLTSTEVNLPGIEGQEGPSKPCALILKGQALRCMQLASQIKAEGKLRQLYPSFAMALSILAAWERIHGTEESRLVHEHALRTTIDAGTEEAPEDDQISLLNSVTHAVRTRFNNLSDIINYDGQFVIPRHLDTMQTQSRGLRVPQKPDYSIFSVDRPETKTLLLLLNRLAEYDLTSPNAWVAMHELSLLIFAWRTRRKPPSNWDCLINREQLEDLALYHIRAGMVAVLGAWTYAVALGMYTNGYFRASDTMDEHYCEMVNLQTDNLYGTDFEEATFWSLYIMTATATPSLWRKQSLDALRRLMASPRLAIITFGELEAVLRKYAYREVVHQKICFALFETLRTGIVADDSVSMRHLKLTLADLAR